MTKTLEEKVSLIGQVMEIPKGIRPSKNPNDALQLGKEAGLVKAWAQNGTLWTINFYGGETKKAITQNVAVIVIDAVLEAKQHLIDESEVDIPKPQVEDREPAEQPSWVEQIMNEHDLSSSDDISFLSDDDILAINGIGPATLEEIRAMYPMPEEE